MIEEEEINNSEQKEIYFRKENGCNGILKDRTKCKNTLIIGVQINDIQICGKYCKNHLYWNDFSKDDIIDILENKGDFRGCNSCGKWHNTKDNHGKYYNNCLFCRLKGRKKDLIRRETEQRKRWKELYSDKALKSSRKSREKKKIEIGLDNYHKLMARQAKQWRDNNPEYMQVIYDKSTNNMDYKYKKCIVYRAMIDNIKVNINFEESCKLFQTECYYCGEKNNSCLNEYIDRRCRSKLCGIDRMDNNIGYTIDNCVPCCIVCNMMKGNKSINNFYGLITQILYNWTLINKNSISFYSTNTKYVQYLKYKERIDDKNNNGKKLCFEIDNKLFDKIIKLNCYLCGKEYSNLHINGIDRVNNDIGYKIGNIMPCCNMCNKLKNKYPINILFRKMYLTYCRYKKIKPLYSIEELNIIVNNMMINKYNRLSKKLGIHIDNIKYLFDDNNVKILEKIYDFYKT